jgi:phosphoglycolate phosphatase-like HAD superfamily hydrolase
MRRLRAIYSQGKAEMVGVLFDLDQTLIDSRSAEAMRRARNWSRAYGLIPGFGKYDGIAAMLAMLQERQVPIGIVTTSPRPYCVRVVDHHGFLIEKLVCYHDTTRRKPHPDPIAKGVELLGIPADQVWAVGDDPKDISAARAAGTHSIAVTWGCADATGLRATQPEAIFDTVADLHAFLDSLTKPPEE